MTPSSLLIEIGQTSVQVLNGEDGLDILIERDDAGGLSAASRERVVSQIKAFLKGRGWGRQRALCGIAGRGVSLRRMTLPAASGDELQRLLLLQIESEFPLSPDELAWGFKALSSGGATQDVLVAAVKKEVMEDYAAWLGECGLTASFTLSALARAALCDTSGNCAILDIGKRQSELLTFERGVPAALRILKWGGENITQAIAISLGLERDTAENLKLDLAQASLSDAAAKEKAQQAIQTEAAALAEAINPSWLGQKLWVCGHTARLRELAPEISRALGASAPCERLETPPGRGRSAATLGLRKAAEGSGKSPLLMLQATNDKRAAALAPAFPWKLAALAAALAAALLAIRFIEPALRKSALQKRVQEARGMRSLTPRIDRELNFMRHLETNQPPYLEALHLLANAAPGGNRLEGVSMNRRGDLTFRGGLQNGQQVLDLRAKLMDSGFFNFVVVDEQTPTPDRQKVNFRMTAQWKPFGARPKLPDPPPAPPGRGGPGVAASPPPDFMPPGMPMMPMP